MAGLLSLSSCTSIAPSGAQSPAYLTKQFQKICLEGAGKGRIELVGHKYTFGFESQINRARNAFDLALDFPIIGETQVSLSLNPKEVSREISRTELVELLREQIGDRPDSAQLVKAIEEFFVFSSDFIRFKASNVFPSHFASSLVNEHFLLSRETPNYRFEVDSFSDNQKYFERTIFKIFLKNGPSSDPVMTLFLVPQNCDPK